MLTPDPKFLRLLLSRYATLRISLLERDSADTQRALEEVNRTLCAATATRTVSDAIVAADAVLEQAHQAEAPRPASAGPGRPLAA
ncbi:DUF5133 domain-containing protein [Streptomyces sp. NBC_01429]|uniref:DUF5133 domain-containing protein n=1 Tax=Streptomyces sp. NBC_01429 TaxID=2903862 RepID=UPI002E29DC2B|nr:DUF5133 domain-containing protein [Streptomyces sp. NBC_01429]